MNQKDALGNDVWVPSPQQRTGTRINDLPPEILAEVFSNVELVQLSTLRLVCKYWNVIVSDNGIWQKSFKAKFGSAEVFPSFAHTRCWVMEYLSRIQNLKRWRKSEATHFTYEIPNLSITDHCLTNFSSDKLLSYSNHQNDVTICTLHNGRGQTFLPGFRFGVRSYAMNWHSFVFGTYDGGLYIKNMNMPASYGISQQESLKEVIPSGGSGSEEAITCVDLNHYSDKHKMKMDIVTGSNTGYVRMFNLSGTMVQHISLNGGILKLKSDFKKDIIAFTQASLFIIDIHTLEVREHMHGITIDPHQKLIVDFDFVDRNVIVCHCNLIRVINYDNSFRERKLELGYNVTLGKIQAHKTEVNRDIKLVGQDGLLYANVLEDDTVIVWNIRDTQERIQIKCQFQTDFKYKSLAPIVRNETEINAIDLNSSVIAVAGYNGFSNIHDVFTGKFLRDASVKFPKKYGYMHSHPVPVQHVKLHESQRSTCGVIFCGNLVQYFQFGDIERDHKNKKTKKVVAETTDRKDEMKKKIRDQLDDYDLEKFHNTKVEEMFDKFNGNEYTSEDELMIAIALSKSSHDNTSSSSVKSPQATEATDNEDMDEDLRKALELSKAQSDFEVAHRDSRSYGKQRRTDNQEDYNDHNEEDEELLRAIELSKQSATKITRLQQLTQDEDLEHGIGSSSQSSSNSATDDAITEDEQLKRILELSLVDQ